MAKQQEPLLLLLEYLLAVLLRVPCRPTCTRNGRCAGGHIATLSRNHLPLLHPHLALRNSHLSLRHISILVRLRHLRSADYRIDLRHVYKLPLHRLIHFIVPILLLLHMHVVTAVLSRHLVHHMITMHLLVRHLVVHIGVHVVVTHVTASIHTHIHIHHTIIISGHLLVALLHAHLPRVLGQRRLRRPCMITNRLLLLPSRHVP
jgi:hypothetical protein